MNTETDFLLKSYDFALPPELIAQHPATSRDKSRLMVLEGAAAPQHREFPDVVGYFRPGDLLVRNNTKVIPARIYGCRATGGKVEILLVHADAEAALAGRVAWNCMARPTKHLKVGEEIIFADGELRGTVEEKLENGQVRFGFAAADGGEFLKTVNKIGHLPLPPYITRAEEKDDRERYQTVYARVPGAVAAPTAGLHFTPEILARLEEKGVETAEVTLHVGPGTFKPLAAEDIRDHQMDAEYYEISPETADKINRARVEGRRVIAVGTTSSRAVESANVDDLVRSGCNWTRLFIMPGYRWKTIDGILTNFHLPKSSLLVLVSALVGRERILAAYAEAVRERYRFYSYGDATLILP